MDLDCLDSAARYAVGDASGDAVCGLELRKCHAAVRKLEHRRYEHSGCD